MQDNKAVVDLGIMNGWKVIPEKYLDHLTKCGYDMTWPNGRERRYRLEEKNIGRCYNSYTCNDCGCSWRVDSSD
jgi:hypothetical protein